MSWADDDAIYTTWGDGWGFEPKVPKKLSMGFVRVVGGPSDTRFEGGFGIYDAPEPWGPWTTAFYTEKWDVGPGEHGDFPAKWMSKDGRELYLVFSCEDSFSVRKATIVLKQDERPSRSDYPASGESK